jgi:hypothetical protein
MELTSTETIRQYDPITRDWVTATVPAEPAKRERSARRRQGPPRRGTPRVDTPLSAGAPLPEWWRDTAYAPAAGPAGFAGRRDMRRPDRRTATMGTAHRKPVIYPGASRDVLAANVTAR